MWDIVCLDLENVNFSFHYIAISYYIRDMESINRKRTYLKQSREE